MSEQDAELTGPDLVSDGVPQQQVADGGTLLGHAEGEPVVLVRRGNEVLALGATCTHYGGPLADGLFDGELLRCPWHHACFSVRTGEPVRAPALNPVATYELQERGGRLFVTGKVERAPRPAPIAEPPESVVIVGGGAAGAAAAEMLRREGYDGPITMVSADAAAPYDRPNLSKDYLAGNAPEDWIPLRPDEFYGERRIDLRLGRRAIGLDVSDRYVLLDDGARLQYGALLLATGADPIRLNVPGSELPHVHYLRTLGDSRAIIAAAERARSAAVVGASFIGLEVAASLRARGLEVHVVAPEPVPMERILGPQLGQFVRSIHEEHGVRFHLERTASAIGEGNVTLSDGSTVDAELVVIGIGVRPALELAERAGLSVDHGVTVDEYLQTSQPGIWAAGDIARWPDHHSGQPIRVEHWVVAQRQGQTAARNMLGRRERFRFAPFFWSQHYDVQISYVGHAESWDRIDLAGSPSEHDCIAAFRKDGKVLAVASIYRDIESLRADMARARRPGSLAPARPRQPLTRRPLASRPHAPGQAQRGRSLPLRRSTSMMASRPTEGRRGR